ncbi:glutamate receptor ionotropic, kainate 2-like [Gigantopelta aegis]|uniref:glutamate receptor ionotropic, kainate 2-like n=1 Tax=Gigantopelta aegis TaxID=1735272 RepID=UPI001B887D90|nr:glutamate receptor ionotropic, kainate 2-like [Gigantopelta aegis]
MDLFPNTRFGFNNRKLKAATIVWSPFVERNKDKNGRDVFEGICMDLLHQLALSLNFTYEVMETPDGEFGTLVNNSWTGLVGLLQREEVDLVVGPLTVTKEREVVMDFIYPFYHDYGKGIYRMPDPVKSKWKTLLRPFKWQVIVALGGVFVCSALILFTTKKAVLHVKTSHKYKYSKDFILTDSVWYTFGTFIKHHARYEHVSGTTKVFVSFLWFFSTIIIAAYSGSLVAFLTVKKTSPPFKTLAEVAKQDTYEWGTIGGSMWVTLFTRSNLTVYKDIWNGVQRFASTDQNVLSSLDGVHKAKVENGNYIFFFDGDIIQLWSEANCDLVMLEETFYQIQYAVGLPNMSPYKKLFSDTMLAIEQSGLLDIWKKRWWPKGNMCVGEQELVARVIDIVDMQSAFYVLCIGLFVGTVILTVEKLRR